MCLNCQMYYNLSKLLFYLLKLFNIFANVGLSFFFMGAVACTFSVFVFWLFKVLRFVGNVAVVVVVVVVGLVIVVIALILCGTNVLVVWWWWWWWCSVADTLILCRGRVLARLLTFKSSSENSWSNCAAYVLLKWGGSRELRYFSSSKL